MSRNICYNIYEHGNVCHSIAAGWDRSDEYVKIYITSLPGLNEVTSDNVSSSFSEK